MPSTSARPSKSGSSATLRRSEPAGRIGALQASAKEIDWVKRKVVVDYADLRKSDVIVCLSDTAMDDTTRVKAQWEVSVGRATLRQTKAKVALMTALPQARKGKGSLFGLISGR